MRLLPAAQNRQTDKESDRQEWLMWNTTDDPRGPIQSQRDSIRALDTYKVERLSLRAPKAVALLVIGESVLVI